MDDALRRGGRVFFTDNAMPVEQAAAEDGRRPMVVAGTTTPWSRTLVGRGVSRRELADGRRFNIVKRAWTPRQLEDELGGLGWEASVYETQGLFLYGTAVRRSPPDWP